MHNAESLPSLLFRRQPRAWRVGVVITEDARTCHPLGRWVASLRATAVARNRTGALRYHVATDLRTKSQIPRLRLSTTAKRRVGKS
jgi:hypothetical protein